MAHSFAPLVFHYEVSIDFQEINREHVLFKKKCRPMAHNSKTPLPLRKKKTHPT
jgi:hypothetical protein